MLNNFVRLTRSLQRQQFRCVSSVKAAVQHRDEEEIDRINWKRRCELATAYRGLEKYNLHEGICNHLTTRAPSLHQEDDVILIVPYGVYWADVTPQCLVGVTLETGKVVEGEGMPDVTAHSIHRGVYRHRPDVQAVMHTHPVYSTVLSLMQDPEIKPMHQNSCRYPKEVVAYDMDYSAVADDENDEADRLGQALGDKQIILMGNHGLTTTGPSVAVAFDDTYYFEVAARLQVLAYQTGKPLTLLREDVAKSIFEAFNSWELYAPKHFEAIQKRLVKEDPTFLQR